jgi:hypothetical protein
MWMVYLAGRSTFVTEEKRFTGRVGGAIAAVFGVAYLFAGVWAANAQPAAVKTGLATHALYKFAGFAGYGWLSLVVVAILLGALAAFARPSAGLLSWAGALVVLLIEITLTVYRDGVRDLTLLSKGFDVWDRTVVTNWGVVGLFLVLFVAGLGVVGWLISVVARAQKPMEGAA